MKIGKRYSGPAILCLQSMVAKNIITEIFLLRSCIKYRHDLGFLEHELISREVKAAHHQSRLHALRETKYNKTLKTVVHGTASVVGMLAQVMGAVLQFQALEERGYHEQLEAELDEFVDQMDCVIGHCSDQLSKMPLREKVKHVTAFGAELVIPGKAFKVVHNVCIRMRPVAIGLFHALRNEQKAVQVGSMDSNFIL